MFVVAVAMEAVENSEHWTEYCSKVAILKYILRICTYLWESKIQQLVNLIFFCLESLLNHLDSMPASNLCMMNHASNPF